MSEIFRALAPRLLAVSLGLTALASSSAAIHGEPTPPILLWLAAAFSLAAGIASIPLPNFPAYGLAMASLVALAGSAYLVASQLPRAAGFGLGAFGALALALAAWPGGRLRALRRSSLAPPSSSPL